MSYSFRMDPDSYFKKGIDTYNTWYKFISRDSYNEEAIESFNTAKNIYLVQKKYNNAILCYEWIIKCSHEIPKDSFGNINKVYEEYADLLLQKKINAPRAIELYSEAIKNFTKEGKFRNIVTIKKKLAEYYKNKSNFQESIVQYQDLKELITDSKYEYNKILQELFVLYITINDYEKAYNTINEKIHKCTEHNLASYTLSTMILDALLCYILIDKECPEIKCNDYCQVYSSFKNSKQHKLLINMFDAMNSNNVEEFERILREYDQNTPLINTNVQLLTKIKEKIENGHDSLC